MPIANKSLYHRFKAIRGKLVIWFFILIVPFYLIMAISDVSGGPEKQLAKMTDAERAYVENTLIKIDNTFTREQVEELLGPPVDSTFGAKIEWKKVFANGKASRVIVYFFNGHANEVRFDGGPGSYYWVKELE